MMPENKEIENVIRKKIKGSYHDVIGKSGYRISGRFLMTVTGWKALRTALEKELNYEI